MGHGAAATTITCIERDVVARAHGLRQVDDALEQDRRHERARHAVARDERERLFGVELRHDDDGAAEEVGVEREGAGRRVIERAGHEVHVRPHEVEGLQARQQRGLVDPRGGARPSASRWCPPCRSSSRPTLSAVVARRTPAGSPAATRSSMCVAHGRRSRPSVIQCRTRGAPRAHRVRRRQERIADEARARRRSRRGCRRPRRPRGDDSSAPGSAPTARGRGRRPAGTRASCGA